MGSAIIICGERHDIGHPVRTFEDADGFNAYTPHRTDDISKVFAYDPAPGLGGRATRYRKRRLLGRDRNLGALRQVVRQVVVHLDGCRDAKMCFDVLHNQRGLSVHFLVDNDGTVYQTLDLVTCAFHAGGINETSIGIEVQNRGDAWRHPNYYKEGRPTVTCRVHGQQFLAYDFTDAQYEAMIRLSGALAQLLRVPLTSPRAPEGELQWTVIDAPRRFHGFLGHYHITRNKWDPGPWDFRRLFRSVGSKQTFPLTPMPDPSSPALTRRWIGRQATRYYETSERDAMAHFPVGPLGRSRLWHGGLHLPAKAGDAVYAPIQGRIVVTRMTASTYVGSCNFVLLAHRFEAGARSFPFFSLYFHLQREGEVWDEEPAPWWPRNPAAARSLEQGHMALLDDGIEAGELIGRVGEAGPRGQREPQLHFSVFAEHDLGQALDPGYWEVVDGGRDSRFCQDRTILDRIDRPFGGRPRDGLLSRRELRRFFREDPRRAALRRTVVRHRSEWTPGDWESELARAPDFASLSALQRRQLVAQQVTPALWWTPAVAKHAKLPADGYVYSYHPIGFVEWYRKLVVDRASMRATGIDDAKTWDPKEAARKDRPTLDTEAPGDMIDEEDLLSGEAGQKLTLEDLVNGYPD